MIVANKLKEENIVEYLLYMWQVEDSIRAFNFDVNAMEPLIRHQVSMGGNKDEVTHWYEGMIDMMQMEGVTERGHLRMNEDTLKEVTDLHRHLLSSLPIYKMVYDEVLPVIVELRTRTGGRDIPEVELCLSAMYGLLLLKMGGKEVGEETQKAFDKITGLFSFLAKAYHERKTESDSVKFI